MSLEEEEEEAGVNQLHESEEPVVIDFMKSDSEKKVRRRQIRSNKREARLAKATRTAHVKLARDVSFGRRNTPLILYQEICV